MKMGIDVSTHNGVIDWKKVKKAGVEFAMIRAGYGKNNIDKYFTANAKGCTENKIPFGVYWFSYAYTPEMAKAEAEYCIRAIKDYNIEYPVAFDFEYDSDEYAQKKGKNITKDLLCNMAKIFLDTIKAAGYTPILYTNIDYLNKGFSVIENDYPIWLAQWSTNEPSHKYMIWQYTSGGKVDGIEGRVDMNKSDYAKPEKVKDEKPKTETSEAKKTVKINQWLIDRMNNIADDVLKGKYGNGNARKTALKNAGYDYASVQDLVNCKASKGSWKGVTKTAFEKTIWSKYLKCAHAVIDGEYGAGENRKKNLKAKGYDAYAVQQIVNAILK